MRISVEPATPEVLRGTRMQITWDGAAKPSVDVPIGHFFGHAYSGHGRWFTSKAAVLGRKPLKDSPYVDYTSAFNSLLLGVTEKEAYSRFPMPFANGATLTIENQSGKRIENLRVRLDVERLEQHPDQLGTLPCNLDRGPGGHRQDAGVRPQEGSRQGGSSEGRARQVRRRDAHRRLALRSRLLVGRRRLDDLDGRKRLAAELPRHGERGVFQQRLVPVRPQGSLGVRDASARPSHRLLLPPQRCVPVSAERSGGGGADGVWSWRKGHS